MEFKGTETTELKRMLTNAFEKALVAFLNTRDGVIYIGVDDDGRVIGVQNLDETFRRIADIVTEQILPDPQQFVEVGSVYVDGKSVISVKVKKRTRPLLYQEIREERARVFRPHRHELPYDDGRTDRKENVAVSPRFVHRR